MSNTRGLENLMIMLLSDFPEKGEDFLAARLCGYPAILDDVLKARRRLCLNPKKFMRKRGKTLLTVFDMMVSGRTITDIAKILGTSRQYVDQVHKALVKLPALQELKKTLKADKRDS